MIQRQLQRPLIPVLLVLALIAGCAALGLATPKTLDERLSYAYEQHTAALQTIASSTNQKLITSADAVSMLAIADQSRLLLDAARSATTAGDVSTAEGRLVLATNVLRELQTYLRTRTNPQRGAST
jgi:hypothetical protein